MRLKAFFSGDKRTVKAKKNILASFALKGIDSIVYLLLVPVTLGFLNPYEYGIWLTLNSILMWINSFDIGLGNGLRNRLAEAVAKNNFTLGRIYVSTTFVMLILIMGGLIIVSTLLEPLVNWYEILGTTSIQVPHLKEIVYVSFLIFCLNFIFKFIGNVYLALQLPAICSAINVTGHVISLIIIYILTQTIPGSLFWTAVAYTSSPLIVYIIAYPITFYKIFPLLRPSFSLFQKKYLKDLLNIGIQFFLLQISSVLLFGLANILISHMFGPESVTPYNIAYRYFSLVPMAMNIILAPMWSATTDAYAKGDIEWIRKSIQKIHKFLIITLTILVSMVLVSNFVYKIWIGTEVTIPITMSILMAVYVFIIISSLTYSNFLNGLGKLKLQTINTVTVALLFCPLCWFLGNILGIYGILVGMCIVNTSGLLLNRIQFYKVLNGVASGIWDK